jgi:hypothetical protein
MPFQIANALGAELRKRLSGDCTPVEMKVLLLRIALRSLEQLHYARQPMSISSRNAVAA